jgi:GntR family transcriptional regulator
MNGPVPSVVPMYHRIYLILREEFSAVRSSQEPLPTELELARRFKVSRITMRKALDQLVKEGLIYRRRGLGSFLKEKATADSGAGQEGGLLDNLISMAAKTTVRVLSLEQLAPTQAVAADLELGDGERVVKAVRLRSLNNEPISHITTFVPERFGACLTPEALAIRPMLSLLEEQGSEVSSARQSITARLADTAVASLLEIEVGSALLAVKRIVRDAKGRPVQLLHGLYRPDRYEYRMDLSRAANGEARIWYQNDSIKPNTA